MTVQQLEQEVKLEVEPEWGLPDLTGLFPGVKAVPLPVLSLDAVYYDTAGSRLARRHITLRFRREVAAGHAEGTWTVKLPSSAPSDGTVLMRTEVTWPEAEVGDGTGTVAPARPRQGRRRPAEAGPPPAPPRSSPVPQGRDTGTASGPGGATENGPGKDRATDLRRPQPGRDRPRQCDRPGSADGRRDVGAAPAPVARVPPVPPVVPLLTRRSASSR